mmetsp:Transcript_36937/g.90031  ORF Transcript_36937/g.90031 Transcript_36937/m.90031 type:complete len:88 (+) Transcript_36937:405-668(+)
MPYWCMKQHLELRFLLSWLDATLVFDAPGDEFLLSRLDLARSNAQKAQSLQRLVPVMYSHRHLTKICVRKLRESSDASCTNPASVDR